MGRAAATLAATRPNRLARTLGQLDRVPAVARPWARNLVLRRAVPFTGTAGLQYVALTPQRVEVAVANQRRVQNHIHGVHAAAMTLLPTAPPQAKITCTPSLYHEEAMACASGVAAKPPV